MNISESNYLTAEISVSFYAFIIVPMLYFTSHDKTNIAEIGLCGDLYAENCMAKRAGTLLTKPIKRMKTESILKPLMKHQISADME